MLQWQLMQWDQTAQENFQKILAKIPVFLRPTAQKKVGEKAESFAAKEGRLSVTEKDLVDAFFAETPFGFHGPLKCDMDEFGIDYTKYGHTR
jgi:hypothetical protein